MEAIVHPHEPSVEWEQMNPLLDEAMAQLRARDRDALVLEIGSCDHERDACDYPDLDMVAKAGVEAYLHRDGTPYPVKPVGAWLVGQEP